MIMRWLLHLFLRKRRPRTLAEERYDLRSRLVLTAVGCSTFKNRRKWKRRK